MVSSTTANAPTARGESAAAVGTPLANLIIDESPSPPLCGADKATFPSAGTQIGDQTATAVAPDPALVLQADSLSDGNAGELCSDSRSNNGPDRIGTTETPHSPVASSDPLLLRRVPTDGSSPQRLLQIQPSSEQHGQHSPSEEQPAAAVKAPMSRIMPYPELWRDLVREVAAPAGGAVAASTRPSLCSCKKLAVSAMLRVDGGDGDGGSPTWRTGRVCANRGNEADCLYRVFNDAPIVPSTTVSHTAINLVLHLHKTKPAAVKRAVVEAERGGRANRDGGVGAGFTYSAGPGAGSAKKDEDPGVGGGGEVTDNLGSKNGNVVLVEVRKWLIDCVASVHCTDEALRAAMLGLVPPELAQLHVSPDGSGQLIALHLAAVALFVQSIATLPEVLKVEGADKVPEIFSISQGSHWSSIIPSTAVRRSGSSVAPEKLGGRRQCSSRHIAAPVLIRASDMVPPSICELANLGGNGVGKSSTRRARRVGGVRGEGGGGGRAGGEASTHSIDSGSSLEGCDVVAASLSSAMMPHTWDGEGRSTSAMTAANATLFSTKGQVQRTLGWDSKAPASPTATTVSRDVAMSSDGCDGGHSTGSIWIDSAGHSIAYGKSDGAGEGCSSGQGQHLSFDGMGSRSISSYYACQYAEAAAKRQRADRSPPTPMAVAGVTKPVGQGYASLFSGDVSAPSGDEFGGVLAYGMSNAQVEAGIGGASFNGLVCDAFGGNSGLGDDDVSGEHADSVDVGSAWIDDVFDGKSVSAFSSNLLYDRYVSDMV